MNNLFPTHSTKAHCCQAVNIFRIYRPLFAFFIWMNLTGLQIFKLSSPTPLSMCESDLQRMNILFVGHDNSEFTPSRFPIFIFLNYQCSVPSSRFQKFSSYLRRLVSPSPGQRDPILAIFILYTLLKDTYSIEVLFKFLYFVYQNQTQYKSSFNFR